MLTCAVLACAGILAVGDFHTAQAQQRPQSGARGESGAAPFNLFERSRAAFEALDEDARRAVQEGLIWSGDYRGMVDGAFGRMTFAALQAFTERAGARGGVAGGAQGDGVLSPARIARLAAIAAREKAAVDFRTLRDARSGVTIALPMKLLTERRDEPDGARHSSRDGSISVETFFIPEREQDLLALYRELRAEGPGRRVTYHILRENFLVVSAETRDGVEYIRVARGMGRDEAVLRGFALSYVRSGRIASDALAMAIANSFEPFSTAAISPARPAVSAPASPARPVGAGRLVGTAAAVAPARYVSVMPRACAGPRVGDAPARILAREEATGLALLAAEGKTPPAPGLFAASAPAPGGNDGARDVYVLFAEAVRGNGTQIALARGAMNTDADRVRLAAPSPGAGALVVLEGRPVGLLAAPSGAPQRVAGPVPPLARDLVTLTTVAAFLRRSGVAFDQQAPDSTPPGSAAGVAGRFSPSLAPVWCEN